jgi:Rrf2 family protein
MQFSSRLPIAVHILLCIEHFQGQYKTTSEFLAGSVNVNPVIIRKTLGQLKRAGLVNVEAGVGGAQLARKPEEITLRDVFAAVEGEEETLFRFHEHPNPECPVGRNVHGLLDARLDNARLAMEHSLEQVTLRDLLEELEHRL